MEMNTEYLKERWLKAELKLDEIMEDIEVAKAKNDKDELELSRSRYEDAVAHARRCKKLYEEESGKGKLYIKDKIYGY